MKQKETKQVKTGIAELDKQIGGGLEPKIHYSSMSYLLTRTEESVHKQLLV